jgi:hypothetical protein
MALRKVAAVGNYVCQMGKSTCVRREILARFSGSGHGQGRGCRLPIWRRVTLGSARYYLQLRMRDTNVNYLNGTGERAGCDEVGPTAAGPGRLIVPV